MRWLLAMGLFLGLMLPIGNVWPCERHPIPERDKGLIMVAPLETTGMYGFWYDTDMDGVADFALIFQQTMNGDYLAWPLFYFYEVDVYGRAEEVWQDQGGAGECGQIRLYYKRTVNH